MYGFFRFVVVFFLIMYYNYYNYWVLYFEEIGDLFYCKYIILKYFQRIIIIGLFISFLKQVLRFEVGNFVNIILLRILLLVIVYLGCVLFFNKMFIRISEFMVGR